LIENVDTEKVISEEVPTVEEIDQIACDAGPCGKENVDATEDAEKVTSEAVNQPAEKEVNSSDGEETEESEDEFEIVVTRHVREGLG